MIFSSGEQASEGMIEICTNDTYTLISDDTCGGKGLTLALGRKCTSAS